MVPVQERVPLFGVQDRIVVTGDAGSEVRPTIAPWKASASTRRPGRRSRSWFRQARRSATPTTSAWARGRGTAASPVHAADVERDGSGGSDPERDERMREGPDFGGLPCLPRAGAFPHTASATERRR